MKHFWHGFQKHGTAPMQFKKHGLVVFWDPAGDTALKDKVVKISAKYPSVKIKFIDVSKEPEALTKHKVTSVPTVLLLKDGRETDRLVDTTMTVLEQFFKKAYT